MTGTLRSLELAVEVQTRQRDARVGQLAAARSGLDAARQQHRQLDQYAGDTRGAWARSGAMHGAERLQHQAGFVHKLEAAITFQQQVIERHQASVDGLAADLVRAGQRLAALQAVVAQEVTRHQKLLDRRAQRQADELAAIRHVHQQKDAPGIGA